MHPTAQTSHSNLAARPLPSTAAVVLAGALTLAVAMGIGRFAFTPLLPLMMQEGLIDAAVGAELAAVNYLGYLVGQPLRLMQACLLAIVLLTAGAGLASTEAVWLALRFGAGVASAWAMVGISSWSLSTLALRGQGALGALVFGGVGGGIVLAGGMAWSLHTGGARALSLQLAAVAGVLGSVVLGLTWRSLRPLAVLASPAALVAAPAAAIHSTALSAMAASALAAS